MSVKCHESCPRFEKGGPPDDDDYGVGGKVAGEAGGDDGPVVYTITAERRKTSEVNGGFS